ncbi:hypothetical protein, partial [Mesorhizobium sp. M4B.F.Ca.ET.019.03.1.1]|uniref:hypothetical protein n=1 Tax=Mesorhizobium sp. M4B.F.Ca.ET.019.03.1.1 TaxID=2496651 RepID=UPI00167E61DA
AAVVKEMKVRDTPAGQFHHGQMEWKLWARQQPFHDFELIGNGLASAKRQKPVISKVAALRFYALPGVDF